MKRLRGLFARIAIRVPVFMAIVAVMFGTVTATSYVWTKHTTAFLEDLAERDLRTRDIVTKLSAGTEALNTRLLGVMAGVFSSPGSADRIKGFVQTIGAEWSALEGILPSDLKSAEWAEGEKAIKALQTLAPKADASLRASKPLTDVYDSWLDIATPLRKSNQLVTQRLDQHLRDQVQLDLALSAWANKLTIGLMLLSFALLAFVCWNLIARIARPIGRLTDIMTRVAGGELEIAVPETGRRDEIGHIARGVEVFRESMIRVRTLSESERIESAARERRHKAMEGFTSDFSSAVSGVLGSFATAASDMREAVGSVLDAAATTRSRMGEVRETSTVSASNLATVASASEEMMASIGEIRRQVERAAEISSGAVVEAGRSSRMVDELAASAQQIGDVVRLIDAVAGQTNLLALNATIEAARAGEAGRGFAVVANEVKGLASQTSKATTEIAERIQRIQGSTADTAEAIRAVADVVRRVDEIARAIAGTMDEQTMAVQEIVRNVQLASTGTTSAVAVVTEVAATTEVATTAADRVLQAVEGVSAQAGELRAEVQSFLKAMNSAGDRREYARYASSTEVQLESASLSRRRVRLMDISRSGARIAGELPLAIGETCRLLVAGDDRPVTVRVARRDDVSVGVTFQLDDATSAVLGPILEAAMAAADQPLAA